MGVVVVWMRDLPVHCSHYTVYGPSSNVFYTLTHNAIIYYFDIYTYFVLEISVEKEKNFVCISL